MVPVFHQLCALNTRLHKKEEEEEEEKATTSASQIAIYLPHSQAR